MPRQALSDGPVLGLTLFGIELSTDTVAAEVRLSGELDMLTAPRLHGVLDQLLDDGYLDVTIDLSELVFLGCAGLTVLTLANIRYRTAGGRITLTHPSPIVRRMLRTTGLRTMNLV